MHLTGKPYLYNMSYMTVTTYKAQDAVLKKVFSNLGKLGIPNCILAGGSALARYYLHHRVSYDLDFFVAGQFSPERLLVQLSKAGIVIHDMQIEEGGSFVTQLHGYTDLLGSTLKISFVEDVYEGMWPTKNFKHVITEKVEGLYHRKLRTISGSGYGKETKGARQTARDLFDTFVLSKKVKPLHSFIEEINKAGANFPQDAFCANILSMPWMDLMDEFDRLERLLPYDSFTFMRDVRKELVNGAIQIQHLQD